MFTQAAVVANITAKLSRNWLLETGAASLYVRQVMAAGQVMLVEPMSCQST